MSVTLVFQQMVIIFILALAGCLLMKLNIFSDHAGKDISGLVINLCNPAMMLSSVWSSDVEISIKNLEVALAISVCVYIVLVVAGFLVPRIIRAPGDQKSHYNLMTIFGNVGFIGIPVVSAVFGPSGVIYTIMFNICYSLLMYTYGITLVAKDFPDKRIEFKPKNLINVGTVSSVISILLYLSNIQLPAILTESVDYIGKATTFLSMVVIGISLAQTPLKETFGDRRTYLFVLVRQLLIPVILGLIMKPFVTDPLIYGVTIIMMSVPAGSMPLMMAEHAGVDGSVLSRGIVVSTLLSVVTIPLVVAFI